MSLVVALAAHAPVAALALPPYADPGGVPHYFGPYGNWAFSPLPKGPIGSLTVDAGGNGYTLATTVTILDAYGTGSGATATATVVGGVIMGFMVTNPGANYTAPIVEITDTTGEDAAATANIGGSNQVVGNPLIARTFPTDTAANVFVVNTHAPLATGQLTAFLIFNQPGSGPKTFNAYVLRPTGVANEYNVVFDSGPLSVPSVTPGTVTRFAVGPIGVLAGDLIAHYGQGIPIDIGLGADTVLYPANTAPTVTVTLGATYPIFSTDRTYSLGAEVGAGLTGGIRKFVNKLPGLGPPTDATDLVVTPGRGPQYIPVAVSEPRTFSGQEADYYEIALVEFNEKMHSDLPPTRLRGYVQLGTAANPGTVPLTYLDGSPICYPSTTCVGGSANQVIWPWITPITWAPSSLQRGEYTAYRTPYRLIRGIRSRFASSSTTCFPPAPVETSSCRWTKPFRVPG